MSGYSDAIKEAFALAKADLPIIDTLELYFEPTKDRILICANTEDIQATLETAEIVTFRAVGFKLALPAKSEKGFQDIDIAISNTDLEASDFLQKTLGYSDPVLCYYRPYLMNDLSQPQMIPPLVLYLSGAEINVDTVNVKASFADIINKRFLTEKYTSTNFPAL